MKHSVFPIWSNEQDTLGDRSWLARTESVQSNKTYTKLLRTSSVIVFPVSVFTNICMMMIGSLNHEMQMLEGFSRWRGVLWKFPETATFSAYVTRLRHVQYVQ